jgi:hypothetical protein
MQQCLQQHTLLLFLRLAMRFRNGSATLSDEPSASLATNLQRRLKNAIVIHTVKFEG